MQLINSSKENYFLKYASDNNISVTKVTDENAIKKEIESRITFNVRDHSFMGSEFIEWKKRQVECIFNSIEAYTVDHSYQENNFKIVGLIEKDGNMFTFDDSFSFHNRTVDFKKCDHCGRAIDRKKMYFIQTEKGLEQVGGSCADALDIPKIISKLDKFFHFADKECSEIEYGSRGQMLFLNIVDYLAIILDRGYQSKSKSDNPTSEQLMEYTRAMYNHDEKTLVSYLPSLAKQNDKVKDMSLTEIIEYWKVKARNADYNSFEFFMNCLNALRNPIAKNMGFFAYALFDFLTSKGFYGSKENDAKIERKALNLEPQKTLDIPNSPFIVHSFNLYESYNQFTGFTDMKRLVKASNENLESVQFYIDNSKCNGIDIGTKLHLRGAVKGVNSHKDHLVLNRVKMTIVK